MLIKSIAALAVVIAPGLLMGQSATPSPSVAASPSATASATATPPPPPVVATGNFPVVDASKLMVLLPEPPAGWNADKAEGSTTQSTGFKITTVGRTYVKGDADDAPTATINVVDSANNKQFQDATKAMWGAPSQSPEGYDKEVTVAGLPGFEHFINADQTGVLWVVVGGRFFVQVETTRQPAAELEGWLKRLDLKKLGELK